MNNLNNAVSALATGLLVSVLASSSASAQVSEAASAWAPGQPYVLSISTSSGIPLMVVAAGRIPLESEPRVALFLPDLRSMDADDGRGLVYTLSIAADETLTGDALGKPQWVVGRVHTEFIQAPAGTIMGSASTDPSGGSVLILAADGLQHVLEHDLSDDIVWNDPCDFGGYPFAGAGSLADESSAELGLGAGVGTLTAATELGGADAQGL